MNNRGSHMLSRATNTGVKILAAPTPRVGRWRGKENCKKKHASYKRTQKAPVRCREAPKWPDANFSSTYGATGLPSISFAVGTLTLARSTTSGFEACGVPVMGYPDVLPNECPRIPTRLEVHMSRLSVGGMGEEIDPSKPQLSVEPFDVGVVEEKLRATLGNCGNIAGLSRLPDIKASDGDPSRTFTDSSGAGGESLMAFAVTMSCLAEADLVIATLDPAATAGSDPTANATGTVLYAGPEGVVTIRAISYAPGEMVRAGLDGAIIAQGNPNAAIVIDQGLPSDLTEEELRSFLVKWGDVLDIYIVRSLVKGGGMEHAVLAAIEEVFVRYTYKECAVWACSSMQGKQLRESHDGKIRSRLAGTSYPEPKQEADPVNQDMNEVTQDGHGAVLDLGYPKAQSVVAPAGLAMGYSHNHQQPMGTAAYHAINTYDQSAYSQTQHVGAGQHQILNQPATIQSASGHHMAYSTTAAQSIGGQPGGQSTRASNGQNSHQDHQNRNQGTYSQIAQSSQGKVASAQGYGQYHPLSGAKPSQGRHGASHGMDTMAHGYYQQSQQQSQQHAMGQQHQGTGSYEAGKWGQQGIKDPHASQHQHQQQQRAQAAAQQTPVSQGEWTEYKTDDGRAYYYHWTSGTTQWEVPREWNTSVNQ